MPNLLLALLMGISHSLSTSASTNVMPPAAASGGAPTEAARPAAWRLWSSAAALAPPTATAPRVAPGAAVVPPGAAVAPPTHVEPTVGPSAQDGPVPRSRGGRGGTELEECPFGCGAVLRNGRPLARHYMSCSNVTTDDRKKFFATGSGFASEAEATMAMHEQHALTRQNFVSYGSSFVCSLRPRASTAAAAAADPVSSSRLPTESLRTTSGAATARIASSGLGFGAAPSQKTAWNCPATAWVERNENETYSFYSFTYHAHGDHAVAAAAPLHDWGLRDRVAALMTASPTSTWQAIFAGALRLADYGRQRLSGALVTTTIYNIILYANLCISAAMEL